MEILFCQHPTDKHLCDPDYQTEFDVCQKLSIKTSLFNFEEILFDGDVILAIKRIASSPEPRTVIYRGWMLPVERYESFYNALKTKNAILVNTPEEYKNTYYLPEYYPLIHKHTPSSVWIDGELSLDFDAIASAISVFGNNPIIVKDYVKSQKHYWLDACYIPDASNRESVEKVVSKFFDLQGQKLQGGLVFREFIELENVGFHPKSKMPLSKEFRVFFFNRKPFFICKYWKDFDYKDSLEIVEGFSEIVANIPSNFFTMDIAKKKDGSWIIVELGSGEVSGLPEDIDPEMFYVALNQKYHERD